LFPFLSFILIVKAQSKVLARKTSLNSTHSDSPASPKKSHYSMFKDVITSNGKIMEKVHTADSVNEQQVMEKFNKVSYII